MKEPREIIVDAGPLIALARQRDSKHAQCVATLKAVPPTARMVTTVSALAEVFAVLPSSVSSIRAVETLLMGIPLALEYIQGHELSRAFELMEKYIDLPMDFADAEILVIAERRSVKTIFTLDRRDFSVYRPRHVRQFDLIP
ncbi:MAG: PIN domain-containing protein [Candidatus Obscuribacterales bacterium]|nr:PIN domain-containing protein [Candidatus Obscuribacterales bacterium]